MHQDESGRNEKIKNTASKGPTCYRRGVNAPKPGAGIQTSSNSANSFSTLSPRSIAIVIAIVAIIVLFVYPAYNAASVNWQTYSSAMFVKAKAEHKMVLLYGFSPRCPYCIKMDKYTLTNVTVINKINSNYVAAKIDINTIKYGSLADHYGMYGTPALVIMDSNGSVKNTIIGYQNVGELLGKL